MAQDLLYGIYIDAFAKQRRRAVVPEFHKPEVDTRRFLRSGETTFKVYDVGGVATGENVTFAVVAFSPTENLQRVIV
jgi:hypothetical protein